MDTHGQSPEDVERTFGRRGWLLVGAIFVSFILVPLVMTLRPPTWVSVRFAYLVLPLVPAVGLAIIAVWATTRP